jgi:GGDEF domain-containing protein
LERRAGEEEEPRSDLDTAARIRRDLIIERGVLDEESLMKSADIAMDFAKQQGRNNFPFYSRDPRP